MKTFARAALLALCAALMPTHAIAQKSDAPRDESGNTSMDYLREGSVFYLKHDFKKAIPPYQKALDLEKKQRALEKKFWFVLVDNLGMAYGISGDLKRAKEVFEYGLTKDDTYPLFYYNMACTYAEMGDEDKAIEYLKSAFKYKENVIEGEQMPDPASDDSFQRFMKDEKFLRALREIAGG
jgi:tetratricopeptide (TPR) repeat protein